MVDEVGEQGGDLADVGERDEDRLRRDRTADRRATEGGLRDHFGRVRDALGNKRDATGRARDLASDERDVTADLRDRLAEKAEESSVPTPTPDALRVSARARQAAASDRRRASQDRRAGAGDRTKSQHDRGSALADRAAAALERDSASIDGLTGAHTRDAGLVELEREMTRAERTTEPLSLAFMDVDRLKTFNDSFGHASGDRKLVEVVEAIQAKVRPYDLVVRVGGDEFLCVLPGLDKADVVSRFASLNVSLSTSAQPVSITVGVAEMEDGDTPAALIARADADLYELRRQQRLPSRVVKKGPDDGPT